MAGWSFSLPTNSTRIGRALRAGRLLLAAGLALIGTAGPTAAETRVVQQLPFSFTVPDSFSGRNATFNFQLWDAAALTKGNLLWEESKTILVPASLSITHQLGSVVSFADPDPVTHTMDPWTSAASSGSRCAAGRLSSARGGCGWPRWSPMRSGAL